MRYTGVRLPKKMIRIIEKLISSNPDLRYENVEDFIIDALNHHLKRVQSLSLRRSERNGKKKQ